MSMRINVEARESSEESAPILDAQRAQSTAFRGGVNLLKQSLGVGLFGVPHMFTWTGLWLALGGYSAIAVMCTYTMVILIKCREHIEFKFNRTITTYGELAEEVWGFWGRLLVEGMVVLLEVTLMCGLIIVVLGSMVEQFSIDRGVAALLVTPLLIAQSMIHWMHELAWLSVLGVMMYFWVFGVVVGQSAGSFDTGVLNAPIIWSQVPRFVGTSLYSLESICCALPLAASLKHPKSAAKITWWSMGIYTGIVLAYSTAAYFGGMGTSTEVTLGLHPGTLTTVTRVIVISGVVSAYGVFLYIPAEIVEVSLAGRIEWSYWRRVALRLVCVTINVFVAWRVPDFSVFTGIVGSTLMSIVGFVIPPCLQATLHGGGVFYVVQCVLFTLVGLFALTVGMWSVFHS